LTQADDILLFSLSAAGLQVKLNALTSWCSKNFITVNKLKTVILIFGVIPASVIAPNFYVGVYKLSISEEERYVGVTVQPGLARPFKVHLEKKASTARYSGHCIFAIQDKTGRLMSMQLKLLYNARVDCHLTHACEVVPDTINAHVKDLEKIQEWFIRWSLHVGKKAPRIALYTETGLIPLRVRRLLLLMCYLQYLLNLKDHHYTHLALTSSRSLYFAGKSSWYGDVQTACERLPFYVRPVPVLADATEIAVYMAEVEKVAEMWLLRQLNRPLPLKMRTYLTCTVSKYRDALASVVFSTHKLAVERLRW
ncbi:hypothetical protein ARMGADRAFT_877960, partial [Armillaria gallica]